MLRNKFSLNVECQTKGLVRNLIRLIFIANLYISCLFFQIEETKAQYTSSSIYELRYHRPYQTIKQKNADIFGWITIPGTRIDYPLMQGKDNDFYLHHLPNKKANPLGSIFLDFRNEQSLNNENTIIYGHNVRNSDDMFSTLLYYEDQDFYQKNPYIIISLENEIRYYKIFATYTTHTNFYYIQTHFTPESPFSKLISDIELRNQLTSQVTYQMDYRLLTLSTCSFRFDQARFVVHAHLIDINEVSG